MASLAAGAALASDEPSVVRGGRLYDDWSIELKDRPPSGPHPAFAARNSGVPASDTWRCKECHGYDYKGNHGIKGIRSSQGGDPAAIIAVLKDATHHYEGLMRDSDLLDLANFVGHGQTDMQTVVDLGRASKTAATSYEKHFGTICAGCHGLDGGHLREVPPLGDTARQNPSKVLHMILNGHAGADMPALRALGLDVAARFLSFLQTLPSINLSVSIAHGGRLYDNWQLEDGARRQSLPHPAYPQNAYYANDVAMTWRCKSCHGWDYQGSKGDYAGGRFATGIKGIRAMEGADPARIATILRDPTHLFGAVLKQRDLQDVANFVSAGQIDMDVAIDRRSRHVHGEAGRGKVYYRTICVGCHGSSDSQRLGRVVKTNPWMGLHTLRNGHPDEKMPALREFDQHVLLDILVYVQGLADTH